LRISAIAIGVLGGVWIVVASVRALGAELIPILAGLGVGGLAVALAAQTTIANFIGGLILFIDKPVRVGDFCRYGEDPSPG
jgi:MscS family membrane protein